MAGKAKRIADPPKICIGKRQRESFTASRGSAGSQFNRVSENSSIINVNSTVLESLFGKQAAFVSFTLRIISRYWG
jgi:hypothetical protein